MHPLVAAVLLGLTRLDAFEVDPKAQPHRQFAQPVERLGGREGDAVVPSDKEVMTTETLL
jgi:hypothetical protein